jgi:peptidoglycan hydrolase-like protein with peptidoglycan-binding domain
MELQIGLRKRGYDPGRLDANYNHMTEKAVKEMELQFGVQVDGVADQNILYLLDLKD